MSRRLGYFTVIILSLVAGSLWSPAAKKVLNPILIAWWPGSLTLDGLHSAEHVIAFTAASFVATLIWRMNRQANWALLFLFVTAVLVELCQHWIYRTNIEWSDVGDDLIGLIGGYILAAFFKPPYNKRQGQGFDDSESNTR